jgi:hypothetical protein
MSERRGAALLKCASLGTEIGFGVIKAPFFVRANAQINALATSIQTAEMMMRPGTTYRRPTREAKPEPPLEPLGCLMRSARLAQSSYDAMNDTYEMALGTGAFVTRA